MILCKTADISEIIPIYSLTSLGATMPQIWKGVVTSLCRERMVRSSSCMASCVCVCGEGACVCACEGGGGVVLRAEENQSQCTASNVNISCNMTAVLLELARSYLFPIHPPCYVTRRRRRLLPKEPVREK